ncbi:MAG: hypothetical protein ACHQRM_15115 [Bacteroidia bacterium]
MHNKTRRPALKPFLRALIEVGFIIFLFYSNLLMGEFTRSNMPGKTLSAALINIFSVPNFIIALTSGIAGFFVFEFMRKKI